MVLTGEQQAIQKLLREVAIEEIRPSASDADRTQTFPEPVWELLADLELTGLTVPESYAGFDADPITYSIVNEEIAYGSLSVATALSVHALATSCLAEFGSGELREYWLPRMATGRPVGAFALSEAEAGSNPAELSTVARRIEDTRGRVTEYVIEGKKHWITNGERSGIVILFAKTDSDDPGSITQFLVPKDSEGLSVGKKESKLGLRASDTTELVFDQVRIPVSHRLTPEGDGLRAALSVLNLGRVGIANQAVGVAQAALDDAISYAAEREQFGGPLTEIQTIRHKLSEMATAVRAARLLAQDAARRTVTGTNQRMVASMAKYFASKTAMSVTNEAIQIHGGYGYSSRLDVERYYRDAKVTEIYEGTTEIQKSIISRELLR